MQWETVIGLEIHVQLNTASKMFSGAATAYGAAPNTQACAVDLGLPGVLPVINAEAVRKAVKFGLAIDARIAEQSVFARKNYFYPDLPKGYQISQYEMPIVSRGKLAITLADGTVKTIGITRAHLEEDAGKSLHEDFHGMSGIDLNRAGTPLLEIVSEPDLRSAREAAIYMKQIHALVVDLEISDGNMQEGSFRCDANVSLRPQGEIKFGTRAEIKNLNSFRFVEQAILHEIDRQRGILESGGQVVQETRLYDPERDETRPMRGKEEANDYRYFPDPDLLPVEITSAEIEAERAQLPKKREAVQTQLMQEDHLPPQVAERLTADPATTLYFNDAVNTTGNRMLLARVTANTMLGDLAALLNRRGENFSSSSVPAKVFGNVIKLLHAGTISANSVPTILQGIADGEGTPEEITEKRGLQQVTDTGLIESLVMEVISANPEQVAQFRAGKDKVLAYLVGQVMKKSQGKANPQQVNDILREKLQEK